MDGVPTVTGRFISEELYEVESENYIVQVPLGAWARDKIELFEGAGARFIAPTNLVFRIKNAPVYFDWRRETDGHFSFQPSLIYGANWVGQEVEAAPDTKEVRMILELIKKETKWRKPSWFHVVKSEAEQLAKKRSVSRDVISDTELSATLEERLCLKKSGYIEGGKLVGVGEYGSLWSTYEGGFDRSGCLWFGSNYVYPTVQGERCSPHSVRCVIGE